MLIKAVNVGEYSIGNIAMVCPGCGNGGTFERVAVSDLYLESAAVGHRRCPNPKCRTYVLIAVKNGALIATFPPQRIDFDTGNVPDPVVSALEEAISCHANSCYVASAIMVRRTLEEICADKGADGPNLKHRIEALGKQIVIPKGLLNGMDDLRLLGNDAAHIEAWTFKEIGETELTVAIKFTKEIIKAVYQYDELLQELRGLKEETD